MKEQLQRQIGPFKLWQWLLIVVAGVGLGLLIRNSMRGGGSTMPAVSEEANPNSMPATQGAPTILQQDFDSIRTIQDEQDRLADELDRREETNLQRQEEFFTDIRKRISNITIPGSDTGDNGEDKAKIQPIGDPVPLKPKPENRERAQIKANILKIFQQEGLKPPNAIRLRRLIAGVESWNAGNKAQGRSYESIRDGLRAWKAKQ